MARWLGIGFLCVVLSPIAAQAACGDVTGDSTATATDALKLLQSAVGEAVVLVCTCEDCTPLETTTTLPGTTSTTFPGTTSTTGPISGSTSGDERAQSFGATFASIQLRG